MPKRGGVKIPKRRWTLDEPWALLGEFDAQQDPLNAQSDRIATLISSAHVDGWTFDVVSAMIPVYVYTPLLSDIDVVSCCGSIVDGIGHDAGRGFGSASFVGFGPRRVRR